MPAVFSQWVITLAPGVREEDFDRFLREEWAPWLASWSEPGSRVRILKGERGAGVGKYALLNHWDSEETRNRYFPGAAPAAHLRMPSTRLTPSGSSSRSSVTGPPATGWS